MLQHTGLLLGYPAANGPREATGELLGNAGGKAEGAGGCPSSGTGTVPSLAGHVPAVAAEPRAGTGPALALAQPCWQSRRCSQQSDVTSNDVCTGRGQDSSAPGAVTPPAPHGLIHSDGITSPQDPIPGIFLSPAQPWRCFLHSHIVWDLVSPPGERHSTGSLFGGGFLGCPSPLGTLQRAPWEFSRIPPSCWRGDKQEGTRRHPRHPGGGDAGAFPRQ